MKDLSIYFDALSDVTRLKIIQLLTEHEMCVCEIQDLLSMSQPAVSHHIRLLKRVGLIDGQKKGKWTYYRINGEKFMKYHGRFSEVALLAIENRVKGGLQASPAQEAEKSYCQLKRRDYFSEKFK